MDVGSPLLAHPQPPVAIDPRQQRPLHHPPMPSQPPLARFDASPRDARSYASLPERLSTAFEVVIGLVGMQLLRALARSAPARLADRCYGVHELFKHFGVVDVSGGVNHREWDTPPVDHNVALRSRFALISVGFGPVFWPPRGRPRWPSPKMLAPSRSRPPCPVDPGGSFGVDPTHLPRAILRGVASRSCPIRSPSPWEASPRGWAS